MIVQQHIEGPFDVCGGKFMITTSTVKRFLQPSSPVPRQAQSNQLLDLPRALSLLRDFYNMREAKGSSECAQGVT